MKIKLHITLLFVLSFTTFSQEKVVETIFENPYNWEKEIINFPIDWAPDLHFVGFEEILFAPNWSKSKHVEFWSLIIGYSVEAEKPVSISTIEDNFEAYFDGLMKPNHWSQNFPNPIVNFEKTNNNSNLNFLGTMQVFDGFHTGKVINLNVKGEQYFCEKLQKSIIKFTLSPKNFSHKIWETLSQIKVKRTICDIKVPKLIKVDKAWSKEIFHFPINFAPEIPFQGYEEARFPPKGWHNENHPNFWSYSFAWNINLNKKITEKELEKYLKIYFEGLNKNKYFKTSVIINKVSEENSISHFKGKLSIFDNFTTKKPLDLNVLIKSKLCKKEEKTLILFKFSPNNFNHKTWKELEKIELINICLD